MKHLFILFLFCTQIYNIYGQDSGSEKIFYIVDSIPIIDEPKADDATLDNSEIEEMVVITNKVELTKMGYPTFNKVITIITKEFKNRPDSLKKIPTTRIMFKKSSVWNLNSTKMPYTGKFIDYYWNGKIMTEGYMKNGCLNGHKANYFHNGIKSFEGYYVNGILSGDYKEFHKNGILKQEGKFENGKEVGKWNDYYSTGLLKRTYQVKNGQINIPKDEMKFYDLLNTGLDYFKNENFNGAIKKYNKAIKINSKYADAYYLRGTAKLYKYDFDDAKLDLDTAIMIEPLYGEAFANRAFSLIQKYEFQGSRVLKEFNGVTVMAGKSQTTIPDDDLKRICFDLNRANELESNNKMIIDAIAKYCNKK